MQAVDKQRSDEDHIGPWDQVASATGSTRGKAKHQVARVVSMSDQSPPTCIMEERCRRNVRQYIDKKEHEADEISPEQRRMLWCTLPSLVVY